jgi:hypothetical protein
MSLPSVSETRAEMAPGPLFVISMWRSGSSLLYALLNKHPQVGLMYEADLLLLRSVSLKPAPLRDWAERWQFWNQAFTRHGMDASEFAAFDRASFRRFFEASHQEFARRKGATIWGDKSPNYYDRMQEMAETFPDAKFIIVWRDPIGTANSILRAAQSGNSYFKRKGSTLRGLLGNGVYKQQCDWLRANGKPVLEVSYEELVSNPALIMQQVCQFLGLQYNEGLAKLEGADRTAIYGGQHHSLVKGNEIVSRPRPSIVNDTLRQKIDCYVKWWKSRYAGTWPPFHPEQQHEVRAAGLFERLADTLSYRILRAYDSFTAFCFCLAPLRMLQAYRNRKYRTPSAPPNQGQRPEPVPAKEA